MQKIIEIPGWGKTYSLLGESDSSVEYFQTVSIVLKELLEKFIEPEKLLEFIQRMNKLRVISFESWNSEQKAFYERIKSHLTGFTLPLQSHLKELSFWDKLNDRRLGFREYQYHLSMLEIELINRMNKEKFLDTDHKIALLPHCLKDLEAECKSVADGFDMVCKSCSKHCYIKAVSKLLKDHLIHPYIWMRSDFKKLGKQLRKENKSLGILGIACIPELMAGMRKCQKYKIPVVGLPLNANRCGRWLGEFYPNSVNIQQLSCLISRI